MLRYWYSFAPLVVIPTVVLTALPWLGLIALFLFTAVAFAVLGALAWGFVFVSQMLVRSVSRGLHVRSGVGWQGGLSAARPRVDPAESMPAGALLLVSPPSDSERST